MGLLNVLRSGVKTANKVTNDLQSSFTFRKYLSSDGAGGVTYGSPVSIPAIIEDKQEEVRTLGGEISQSKTHITVLDVAKLSDATNGEGVKEQDEIVLANAEIGTILSISGFIDRGTELPLVVEIYLG